MRAHPLAACSAVLLTSAAIVLAPSACAPVENGAETAAQASTAGDLAEAKAMVALLGGDNGRCKDCHGITAQKLRTWGAALKDVETSCFAAAGLSPMDRVNCLRSTPTDPTSPFTPRRLGLYAADARHDSFKILFQSAFPAATWSATYDAFTQRTAMPRSGTPLTPDEFAKLKGWVLRGMPQLDEAFAAAPGTRACSPRTTSELAAHLTRMKAEGWGARLADQSTPMFGCGSGTSALDCLTQRPDATPTFGASGVQQTMRLLRKQPLASRYWVRSSADGRYVGLGLFTSSTIVDLTKPDSAPAITVAADYDPFFLPSNDGFAFAGSHSDSGIHLCRQSLLADVASATSPSITLTEPKCTSISEQVYESIGAALDGGRYFMTWGSHENDDGGNDITSPLPAAFSSSSKTTFVPMVNDGQAYRPQPAIAVTLPYEGDTMLSPSTLLAASRFGNGSKQTGYRIRFVNPVQSGSSLTIDTPLAAEICMPGGKLGFSFDERFVVTHQYVDHGEPDQARLPENSSNIMLADLATGSQIRLTSSKVNQYALYPHFRADGWLYFLVRDMDANVEYVVATDAALRMPSP